MDFPGDFNEALDNDDTILATEVDAQTGTAGDTIFEKQMNVTEQDQTGELNLCSAVEIKDPSLSSTGDSSENDSD